MELEDELVGLILTASVIPFERWGVRVLNVFPFRRISVAETSAQARAGGRRGYPQMSASPSRFETLIESFEYFEVAFVG